MAIIRQNNWVPQQRVDIPMLRTIESAICADFDSLAGLGLAGREPIVLRSFTIPVANTIGQQAPALQLNTASGLIMHWGASQAGTIFSVSDTQAPEPLTGTNPNVTGSFVANVTNYVGLDLTRNPDPSTSDTIQILDVSVDQEVPEVVPLASTMQYKIIISTQSFSSSTNILPIAKVVTDVNNNVVSIMDCRNMMFRLGSGGDSAYALNTYPWGSRNENSILYTGGGNPFQGEDKSIDNLTSWMDAVMTLIWEARGGEYWYTPSLRDNVKLIYGEPVLTINNDNFYYTGTNIQWGGLAIAYENAISGTYYNTITDSASIGGGTGYALSNGQCLYVDIARESAAALIPGVTNLSSLGTSVIPGRRFVLAWMYNGYVFTRDRAYEIGRDFVVANTTTLGVVELSAASATPLTPKVISDGGGTILPPTNIVGLNVNAGGSTSVALIAKGSGASTPSLSGNQVGSGLLGVGGAGAYGLIGYGGTGNAGGIQGYANASGTGDGGDFQSGGSGSSSYGVVGFGTNSNHGVAGFGGTPSSGGGGKGGVFDGGNAAVAGNGGDGVDGTGGAATGSGNNNGGNGIFGTGGVATNNGTPGAGVSGLGANATSYTGAEAGVGVVGTGGTSSGSTNQAGNGGSFQGGAASGGGFSGTGIAAVSGTGTGGVAGYFNSGPSTGSGSNQAAAILATGNSSQGWNANGYPNNMAMQISSGLGIWFLDSTSISTSQAVNNVLTKKNVPKAWASCSVNFTSQTITVNDGFNIDTSSCTCNNSGVISIHFTSVGAFANTNYAPMAMSGYGWVQCGIVSTTACNFSIYNTSIITSGAANLFVVVFGDQ